MGIGRTPPDRVSALQRGTSLGPAAPGGATIPAWFLRSSFAERALGAAQSICVVSAVMAASFGCSGSGETAPLPPALMHERTASTAFGVAQSRWQHVPVPSADGPELAAVVLAAPVMDAPGKNPTPIGYLRLGERVARSAEPVTTEGCPGGWYAVRPVGFVCQDDRVTQRMDHPLVRAFPDGPERSRPLPYRYAFVRSVVPNYLKVPSQEEQERYEMHLERHLRSYAKLKRSWDQFTPGANQLPLSSSGAVSGTLAGDATAPNMNERYGGHGDDTTPWWLVGERRVPNVSTFQAPPYAVIAGRVKRHAGVALVDSFVAGPEALGRRFAVSVDGRLIPADKLKPEAGSLFHGAELAGKSLPVAFSFREGTRLWDFASGGAPARGEQLPHRTLLELTGKVKNFRGERYVETRDGHWARSGDLKTAAAPSAVPWFAKRGVRWVDISILNQTLTLYEGSQPIYVTLVSTGRDGLGEPGKTLSTPTGTFRIYQKHVTTTMDSSVADSEFELRDVPWVMYFQGGYALHGAYWHDDFGRPRSHGCINLSPVDARYVFSWVTPDVPEDWHGASAGDTMGPGTLLNIHP
ncbi:MAG TPA: L,D-transpeptidase [Polyangiaceae bacterium]|nr:L,D-transpeptidase [Polyangiaceae bacterium]